MNASCSPERLILNLLRSTAKPLSFEDIIRKVPELSWNQVFLTVDALNRRGDIILSRRGFEYQAIAAGDLAHQ
jgi:hypothetical protein